VVHHAVTKARRAELAPLRFVNEEVGMDLLMQMVQKVLDGQKDIREDVREIKTRLGRLETDVAQLHVYRAEQSTRLDRLSDRLERVERRLEIVETNVERQSQVSVWNRPPRRTRHVSELHWPRPGQDL